MRLVLLAMCMFVTGCGGCNKPPAVSGEAETIARDEGRRAWQAKATADANPYRGSMYRIGESRAWLEGWIAASKESK